MKKKIKKSLAITIAFIVGVLLVSVLIVHAANMGFINDDLIVSGIIDVTGIADGGLASYDLKVGDTVTPDYGMVRIGDFIIGRTSYKAGSVDADGAVVFRNMGGPVTGKMEFIFSEAAGNSTRFAIPSSGVGNATYNARSMLLAGPAPVNTDMVTVGYWQTNNSIFDNLLCDTSGFGADLGVQWNLEVENDIFTDSIKESTTGAGVVFGNVANLTAGSIASLTTITDADTPFTLSDEAYLICDSTNSVLVVNLPAAATTTGRAYRIKNSGAVANDVTVDANASETIDGVLTVTLIDKEALTIVSDGSNWHIM